MSQGRLCYKEVADTAPAEHRGGEPIHRKPCCLIHWHNYMISKIIIIIIQKNYYYHYYNNWHTPCILVDSSILSLFINANYFGAWSTYLKTKVLQLKTLVKTTDIVLKLDRMSLGRCPLPPDPGYEATSNYYSPETTERGDKNNNNLIVI